MNRSPFSTLRAATLAATILLAGGAIGAAPGSLLHKPAPDFVRKDIQGQAVDMASYRGRVVLLTFWATWCAPCQVEMPHFVRWQSEFAPQGFQIIAVSMDDDAAPVVALTRKRHVNYPVVMGDERLGILYGGVMGLPVNFLIDRHGMVAGIFKGGSHLDAMKARIRDLLAAR